MKHKTLVIEAPRRALEMLRLLLPYAGASISEELLYAAILSRIAEDLSFPGTVHWTACRHTFYIQNGFVPTDGLPPNSYGYVTGGYTIRADEMGKRKLAALVLELHFGIFKELEQMKVYNNPKGEIALTYLPHHKLENDNALVFQLAV